MSNIHLKYNSATALTNNQIIKYNTVTSAVTVSQIFDNGTNVAIGTGFTSPTATVHIKGIDSTSSNYAFKVDNSGGTNWMLIRNDGNIGMNVANPLATLHTNSNAQPSLIVVRSGGGSGTMGINNTAPTQALVIGDGSQTANNWFRINANKSDLYIGQNPGSSWFGIGTDMAIIENESNFPLGIGTYSNQDVHIGTNNVSRIKITNAGSVGVGTTSPTSTTRLHIKSFTTGTANNILQADNSTNVEVFSVQDIGQLRLSYDPSNNMTAIVSTAGIVTFNATGSSSSFNFNNNVGIGFSGASPTARLHVKGSGSSSTSKAFQIDSSSTSDLLNMRNDGRLLVGFNGATYPSLFANGIAHFAIDAPSNGTGSGLGGFIISSKSDLNKAITLQWDTTNDEGMITANNTGVGVKHLRIQAFDGARVAMGGNAGSFFTPTSKLEVSGAIHAKTGDGTVHGTIRIEDIGTGGKKWSINSASSAFSQGAGTLFTHNDTDDTYGWLMSKGGQILFSSVQGLPTAQVQVIGTGSTSTSYTAKFQNSVSGNTLFIRDDRNMSYLTESYGSGVGVISIGEVLTAPTTNPTGSTIFYTEGGSLKYRDTSGNTITL